MTSEQLDQGLTAKITAFQASIKELEDLGEGNKRKLSEAISRLIAEKAQLNKEVEAYQANLTQLGQQRDQILAEIAKTKKDLEDEIAKIKANVLNVQEKDKDIALSVSVEAPSDPLKKEVINYERVAANLKNELELALHNKVKEEEIDWYQFGLEAKLNLLLVKVEGAHAPGLFRNFFWGSNGILEFYVKGTLTSGNHKRNVMMKLKLDFVDGKLVPIDFTEFDAVIDTDLDQLRDIRRPEYANSLNPLQQALYRKKMDALEGYKRQLEEVARSASGGATPKPGKLCEVAITGADIRALAPGSPDEKK
jgi:hypothetical protein